MASVTRFTTPAQLLDQISTVDGAGSGLNADELDGLSSLAFVKADGSVTGATVAPQPFTLGIVTGGIRPPSNSTTAIKFQNAAGSTIGRFDTTNNFFIMDYGRIGIQISPAYPLDIYESVNSITGFRIQNPNTGTSAQIQNKLENNAGGIAYYGISGSNYSGFAPLNGGKAFWLGYGVDAVFGAQDSRNIIFSQNGAEIARFNTSGRLGVGTTSPATAIDAADTNAATNAIQNAITFRSTNAGTPAAGFGVGLRAGLKSSTTVDQDAGRITWQWETATHASRASKGQLTSYYTSTERPAITWGSNSTVALLSFYDITTPIARQVLATGVSATVDDVITALQALGLVKQS